MAPIVWIVVIYNLLHQPQGVLTQRYNSAQECHLALATQHFNIGYWGSCEPVPPTQARHLRLPNGDHFMSSPKYHRRGGDE